MARARSVLALLSLLCSALQAGAQDVPAFVGYVAYVGNDHNVYVIDGALTITPVTHDASSSRRYQFPTWSTDGRLAFFCCDPSRSPEMTLEAYVASTDMTAAKLLYDSVGEAYTYAYWSPANCVAGPDCRDLAVLVTRRGQPFKVELIRSNGIETSSRTAATGAPFYLSWNADGERMLWHRNNNSISVFDAATDTSVGELVVTPSGFQAPAWSPVDDRAALVLLEASGTTNALVVVDGDQQDVLVRGIPSAIRGFVNVTALSWSPDGRHIAYRAINRFGASPLFVVDSETGAVRAATSDVNVLAFFWSPDSSRLAYMTPYIAEGGAAMSRVSNQRQTGEPLFLWSVLDVASGNATPLVGFTPPPAMTYLLAYFDQYSQSHQLWSPDSRYLVYSDLAFGGTSAVKILDTTSATPVPLSIAEGDIGIWSYN